MNKKLRNILVTGGYGFIGSNFIRYIFEKTNFEGNVVNLDILTYAANPMNLYDIQEEFGDKKYFFVRGDICNAEDVKMVFEKYQIDTVVHFAAESHVDRSILGPEAFIKTNITGTFNLLNTAYKFWMESPFKYNPKFNTKNSIMPRFHHISTDEVYGSLGETGYFYETTPYDPRSPYSASKASSDHLAMAYFHTYGLPVTLSNCTNNYGPYQFPEKLIPLVLINILDEKPLPVYGDGKNIRDWVYVDDHNDGVWKIIENGKVGEKYNIGGENEWTNIELVQKICEIMDKIKPSKNIKSYKELITFVKDRPGHDRRYAINCDKIKNELGWKQNTDFETGLNKTVKWYLDNIKWVEDVRSGNYKKWIKENYKERQ